MKLPFLGTVDERFLMHRLRSTSIGGIAGALLAAGFFYYQFFVNHVYRWDLFAVVATVVVVKIAVLIWYRFTD